MCRAQKTSRKRTQLSRYFSATRDEPGQQAGKYDAFGRTSKNLADDRKASEQHYEDNRHTRMSGAAKHLMDVTLPALKDEAGQQAGKYDAFGRTKKDVQKAMELEAQKKKDRKPAFVHKLGIRSS